MTVSMTPARRCRFYLSGKWNMGNWAVAFSCTALALAVEVFHTTAPSLVSRVLVYIFMSVAACANVVCFGHFVRDVATFKVFVSEKELTPLAIMKLTHEAIRCATLLHTSSLQQRLVC